MILSVLFLCFSHFSPDAIFMFRDGQCPEYTGEEQVICAVGLAKSRPGVFVEAIQYLMVLATPVEVVSFFSFVMLVIFLVLISSPSLL